MACIIAASLQMRLYYMYIIVDDFIVMIMFLVEHWFLDIINPEVICQSCEQVLGPLKYKIPP
jgi:hypothetical protein